ncbi:hypothetical protein [Microseira wollei]|uniref:Uncharacterized protein n=1 Tax=Microseira wollei NIES-4236 TaxID=2530354 RepID=A0AAV3XPN5_9CYAN|nr:hypothetical protein [Microseira wollei]GET42806.1 hypothetical protein MiSe_76240 [Microseira wollei NIES-4236]
MTRKDLIRHQIFTIENILSPAECAEYIELSENIGYACVLTSAITSALSWMI